MRKKGLALLLAIGLLAANIAGCGSSLQDGADKRESVRLMVWSPSEDQSKDSGEWLQRTCLCGRAPGVGYHLCLRCGG